MDTFQSIRERRSIKHFDPVHRMTPQEERKLIDLALEAPSSFNIQHWRLVNVKNPDVRARIRAAAFGQEQITDASLMFVICADVKAWAKGPSRYWAEAPENVQNLLVPMLQSFYDGNEQLQRDEAIRSTTFMAQTMMLTAKAMGYDSCALIGFDPVEVGKIIDLPQDHIISMLLTIGKGIKPAWPKPGYVDRSELIFENSFSGRAEWANGQPISEKAGTKGFWSSI